MLALKHESLFILNSNALECPAFYPVTLLWVNLISLTCVTQLTALADDSKDIAGWANWQSTGKKQIWQELPVFPVPDAIITQIPTTWRLGLRPWIEETATQGDTQLQRHISMKLKKLKFQAFSLVWACSPNFICFFLIDLIHKIKSMKLCKLQAPKTWICAMQCVYVRSRKQSQNLPLPSSLLFLFLLQTVEGDLSPKNRSVNVW